jgi:hypothetical protein
VSGFSCRDGGITNTLSKVGLLTRVCLFVFFLGGGWGWVGGGGEDFVL